MAETGWDVELFSAELAARLVAALGGAWDADALSSAVTECSLVAETACHGRMMACSAGCPHCCVLNVAVLLPEALVIAQWLEERLPPAELKALRKELAVHRCWTRWMDDEERIAKRMTCPFLDQAGSCIIHPVRPLACRGVASLDKDSCRGELSPVITDEVRLVVSDLLRRAAYDTGFHVLARIVKLHALDDRSIELGSGVLAFLESTERRELFLSGSRLPNELWTV